MPLLAINADASAFRIDGGEAALSRALADLPRGAPVVVMIHGFRFAPGARVHDDPHQHILSFTPVEGCWKAISWPRHLGFGRTPQEGLAIAFGWRALGTIWQAHAEAARAGRALADLLARIHALRPDARISAIGHSLGARVILQSLRHQAVPVLSRAVLIAAAEFRRPTLAALETPAGRACEIVNITSRENDLFDFLIERLLTRRMDRAIGLGLGRRHPRWIDLQLDAPETLAALGRMGFQIAGAEARICHWSLYLRPGVFALYRALLCEGLPLARLPVLAQSARWSRFLPRGFVTTDLPYTETASYSR